MEARNQCLNLDKSLILGIAIKKGYENSFDLTCGQEYFYKPLTEFGLSIFFFDLWCPLCSAPPSCDFLLVLSVCCLCCGPLAQPSSFQLAPVVRTRPSDPTTGRRAREREERGKPHQRNPINPTKRQLQAPSKKKNSLYISV